MSEAKFLLVSLKEDEAKKLAQVISNDTSRRILDFLAGVKDTTESEIAKKLSVPISTVHYNMSALRKAGLVNADEFHYSEKGKEVIHYSLASKYVIIAPKGASASLRSKLQRILPVAIAVLGASAIIQLLHMLFRGTEMIVTVPPQAFTTSAKDAGTLMAERASEQASNAVAAGSMSYISPASEFLHTIWNSTALWFLFGAAFAMILFIVVDRLQRRK